jgi:hypothetical protein
LSIVSVHCSLLGTDQQMVPQIAPSPESHPMDHLVFGIWHLASAGTEQLLMIEFPRRGPTHNPQVNSQIDWDADCGSVRRVDFPGLREQRTRERSD